MADPKPNLTIEEVLERPLTPKSNIHIELSDIKSFNEAPLEIMIKPGKVTVLLCDDEILTEGILLSAAGIDHKAEDVIKIQNTGKHYCLYIPSDPTDFLERYGYSETLSIGELYFSISGLYLIEERMQELEEAMSNPDFTEEMMNEYGELQTLYANLRGYDKEAWAFEIITRLGLAEDGFTINTPVNQASTGQKSKILLGMGIFANPTVLVLDNVFPHLDTNSKDWLAEHLRTSDRGVILAAYEEETPFLDKVADSTVFVEYGFGYSIDGNVSTSRSNLEQLYAQQAQEAKVFRTDLERREAVVHERKNNPKFRRSKNAMQVVMAQYRRTQREREELLSMTGHIREQAMGRPPKDQYFRAQTPSSNSVLKVIAPRIMYGNKTGFSMPKLQLDIKRGDKIAILGPNGSGKSTLSRTLVAAASGQNPNLAEGDIKVGTDLNVGYFSPDLLYEGTIRRERRKILDFVVEQDGIGESSRNRARGILAFWGFSKDEMEHLQVARLGRRAKTQLSMAILMLLNPNLLVLDEPTADLPDTMVERLLDSLSDYNGTLITISHEPSFIEAVYPNKILDLNLGKVILADEA